MKHIIRLAVSAGTFPGAVLFQLEKLMGSRNSVGLFSGPVKIFETMFPHLSSALN